jgi:hypothetical protein
VRGVNLQIETDSRDEHGEPRLIECPGSGGAMSYSEIICRLNWAGTPEWEANAHLIAASPRLLEALTEVESLIGGWREMVAELEDFCSEPVRLSAMIAALNQIDRCRPMIRAALATARQQEG